MNTHCSFDAEEKVLSFEKLRKLYGTCHHVSNALGDTISKRPSPVDITLYYEMPCGRRADLLSGIVCNRNPTSRLVVHARASPAFEYRAKSVDHIFISGCISAVRKGDILFDGKDFWDDMDLVVAPWCSQAPRGPDGSYGGEFDSDSVLVTPKNEAHRKEVAIIADFDVKGENQRPSFVKQQARMIMKTMTEQSIVSVDLKGYELLTKDIESGVGSPEAVLQLNEAIRVLITRAMTNTGSEGEIIADTGDGAIVRYADSASACRFAQLLHAAADEHRKARGSKWEFRIGIATGNLAARTDASGKVAFGGVAISRAVRLQAAATPSSTVIDAVTHRALEKLDESEVARPRLEFFQIKTEWVQISVTTKHNEIIVAFKWTRASGSEAEPAPHTISKDPLNRKALVDKLMALYPHTKLERIIFSLNMPIEIRPSVYLSHADRVITVLNWVESPGGPGLDAIDGSFFL